MIVIKHKRAFVRRLGFYLIGFVIGLFLLGKFYDNKNASFDYFGNARTLKSIRNKPHLIYSDYAKESMNKYGIDTAAVNTLLHNGNVEFNASNRGYDPCKTYLIISTELTAPLRIKVERCDSTATILEVEPDTLRKP
jgi:hypothetical protein